MVCSSCTREGGNLGCVKRYPPLIVFDVASAVYAIVVARGGSGGSSVRDVSAEPSKARALPPIARQLRKARRSKRRLPWTIKGDRTHDCLHDRVALCAGLRLKPAQQLAAVSREQLEELDI